MTCRLQRDFTDSTLLRNVGVACGHLTLSIRKMISGFDRISYNIETIESDLHNNNIIKMEYIQLLFRKWDIPNGYDVCKLYSRGKLSFNMEHFIGKCSENNITFDVKQLKCLYSL